MIPEDEPRWVRDLFVKLDATDTPVTTFQEAMQTEMLGPLMSKMRSLSEENFRRSRKGGPLVAGVFTASDRRVSIGLDPGNSTTSLLEDPVVFAIRLAQRRLGQCFGKIGDYKLLTIGPPSLAGMQTIFESHISEVHYGLTVENLKASGLQIDFRCYSPKFKKQMRKGGITVKSVQGSLCWCLLSDYVTQLGQQAPSSPGAVDQCPRH